VTKLQLTRAVESCKAEASRAERAERQVTRATTDANAAKENAQAVVAQARMEAAESVATLKTEMGMRLAAAERKLAVAIRERDAAMLRARVAEDLYASTLSERVKRLLTRVRAFASGLWRLSHTAPARLSGSVSRLRGKVVSTRPQAIQALGGRRS